MYEITSGVTLSFSGVTRRIILDIDSGITSSTVKVEDIFNYWRIWVVDSGSSYYQAFDRAGGEQIESGQKISTYYILVNNWKLVINSITTSELVIDGNLIDKNNTSVIALSECTGSVFLRSVISANIITVESSSCTGITSTLQSIQSGITEIENDLTIINDNLLLVNDNIDEHRAATENRIKYILGMVQQNFRVKNQVYDANNLLTSSTIRIYNNATDAENDTSPLKEYSMTASYDGDGKLINYLVKEL